MARYSRGIGGVVGERALHNAAAEKEPEEVRHALRAAYRSRKSAVQTHAANAVGVCLLH